MMKKLCIILLLGLTACMEEGNFSEKETNPGSHYESEFDPERWKVKEGKDYPFREEMLQDLVYQQQLKGLTKEELLQFLGEPDRSHQGFLYYRVAQKRLGLWPLHTTSLVIELSADSIVKTRRIHE